MKEYELYNDLSQKEALNNEFKGLIFEFLIASAIARKAHKYSEFFKGVDPSLYDRLLNYQKHLQQNEPKLLRSLEHLASLTFNSLEEKLPKYIEGVFLVGKLSDRALQEEWGEADILLTVKNSSYFPISLKLCKSHSFVNTKSAGIKSFIQKYFSDFDDAYFFQKKLNLLLDESFDDFGQKVYDHYHLGEFNGRFDDRYRDQDLSELPGDLPENLSELIKIHYEKMIGEIYQAFNSFYNDDRDLFLKGLFPLLGLSNDNIFQVNCFYKSSHHEKYIFDRVKFYDSDLSGLSSNDIFLNTPKNASFEVCFPDFALQIRVKPMNKFTPKALKINCSVK